MGDNNTLVEDCFGVLRREGQPSELVRRFTISNEKISFQVITYGATITSIKVPDKDGIVDDVVLGFDDLAGYLRHQHYFGCTIGRVANRISKACFQLQGQEYRLAKNNGTNHLHGGLRGFDKVLWDSHVEGKTVTFSYTSPCWEESYPGDVECQVMYELSEDNEIIIYYKATSTHVTPINLTNHSYFNLGGHASGTISDHILNVSADRYTPVDENLIPTGQIASVEGTPYDLRQPKRLGSVLAQLPCENLDINFCVNGVAGEEREVARLYHPKTGRALKVSSTQPGVQVYSGTFLPTTDTLCGKGGNFYHRHGGLCLETQNYPDAVNNPNFPSCLIGAGDVYEHTTVLSFSTGEPAS